MWWILARYVGNSHPVPFLREPPVSLPLRPAFVLVPLPPGRHPFPLACAPPPRPQLVQYISLYAVERESRMSACRGVGGGGESGRARRPPPPPASPPPPEPRRRPLAATTATFPGASERVPTARSRGRPGNSRRRRRASREQPRAAPPSGVWGAIVEVVASAPPPGYAGGGWVSRFVGRWRAGPPASVASRGGR